MYGKLPRFKRQLWSLMFNSSKICKLSSWNAAAVCTHCNLLHYHSTVEQQRMMPEYWTRISNCWPCSYGVAAYATAKLKSKRHRHITLILCQTLSKSETDKRANGQVDKMPGIELGDLSPKTLHTVAIILIIFPIMNWTKFRVFIGWSRIFNPPPTKPLKFLWSIALRPSLTDTTEKRRCLFFLFLCLCLGWSLTHSATSNRPTPTSTIRGILKQFFFHQRSISNNFSLKAHRSQIFTSNIPDFILICNFIFDVVFCRC